MAAREFAFGGLAGAIFAKFGGMELLEADHVIDCARRLLWMAKFGGESPVPA